MNYLLEDYVQAATTKQKMPHTYAIVHFDCDDGMMLYGISKTVKFCDGAFLGNKTWAFINDSGMTNETFEQKIKDYVKKFENKGHKVNITMVLS
jgi:hypothetical protein